MSGLAGLDRKQMEAERLARATGKRKAPADETPSLHEDNDRKRVKTAQSLDNTSEKPVMTLNEQSRDVKSLDTKFAKITSEQSIKPAAQATSSQLPKAIPSTSTDAPTTTPPSSPLQYPTSALKRTWAYGHPRAADIKIEEVLQKNTLNTAVISSWQWDFDWLMTKFVPGKTKFVFVMEAKDETEMNRRREEFAGLESMVRLVFPPMSKSFYSRMHSKLMLLFHPAYLRVVVPSANPTKHDWGESGLLENTIFLIDLPRLSSTTPQTTTTPYTPFQTSLHHFLRAQNFPADVLTGLDNFDFSATTDIAFIHSIPGTYADEEETITTGLPSLAKEIRVLTKSDTKLEKSVSIDYATSSLGALDETQVATLVCTLRGEDPFQALRVRKGGMVNSDANKAASENNFHIVFPSKSTVQSSRGGSDAAGTIFLPSKTYNKPSFPRHLLRDYRSSRDGLLSHNKVCVISLVLSSSSFSYATIREHFSRPSSHNHPFSNPSHPPNPSSCPKTTQTPLTPHLLILTRTPHTAHIYHGSANLSASAWGRLSLSSSSSTSKAKSKGKPSTSISTSTARQSKMTIANWECGVLLPLICKGGGKGRSDGEGGGSEMVRRGDGNEGEEGEGDGEKEEVQSLTEVKRVLCERWGMELPFLLPARLYQSDEVAWTQEGGL